MSFSFEFTANKSLFYWQFAKQNVAAVLCIVRNLESRSSMKQLLLQCYYYKYSARNTANKKPDAAALEYVKNTQDGRIQMQNLKSQATIDKLFSELTNVYPRLQMFGPIARRWDYIMGRSDFSSLLYNCHFQGLYKS